MLWEMHATDRWWNAVTAGSDGSDGVVQLGSQVYPGALLNVQALRATSHTGETNAGRSYDEIRRVLTEELGVEVRE